MKGIMFCELLANKTVAKEKTMTRREHSLKAINNEPDKWMLKYVTQYEGCCFRHVDGISTQYFMPHYKVGEVVYIKEPTFTNVFGDVFYKYGAIFEAVTKDGIDAINHDGPMKFGNKLFMGADKARYYIRITSVKVERLYDISEDDCLKEGVEQRIVVDPEFNVPVRGFRNYLSMSDWFATGDGMFIPEQRSFFSLFRFANRVPKLKEIPNLWVFCYEYCLCDINGNEL